MDDPRDLDMAPDQGQESPDHAPSGGWYPGEEEPHAWAGDGVGSDLLPGLDPEQGSRGGTGGGSGGKARKKGRRRVRIILLAILTVFVLLIVAAGGVGYHYYKTYIDPPDFSGPGTGTVVVQIKPGQFADQIGLTLASDGVVASARAFSNAAKDSPQGNALEPGYYQVHKHMKASLALALLLKPSSRAADQGHGHPEGFRVAQIIALLGQETGNLKGYEQAIAHPAALGLPAFANGKPEGYLFPATYPVQPNTPPAAVLKGMVSQFKAYAQSIGLQAAAARGQETQAAVITVASLLEAEGRPPDFRKIAEVIYNRLNMHMKLQLDTTVLYGMSLAHKSAFSTNFPSPYNTYLHAGLPPGPIDNPGSTAIQAALHPTMATLPVLPDHQLDQREDPVLHQRGGLQRRGRPSTAPTAGAPAPAPVRAERQDHESRGSRLSDRSLAVAGPAPCGVPGAGPGRLGVPGDRVRRGRPARADRAVRAGLGRAVPDHAAQARGAAPARRSRATGGRGRRGQHRDLRRRPPPGSQHRRPGHDRGAGREPAARGGGPPGIPRVAGPRR